MSEPPNLKINRNAKRFSLRCPAFLQADLKAHLDGELRPLRRALVRWHIGHCANCREEFAWLRRLGEDMRDLEQATPDPKLRARILANLPPPSPVRFPIRAGERAQKNWGRAPRYALASLLLFGVFGGAFALTAPLFHKPKTTQPKRNVRADVPEDAPSPAPAESPDNSPQTAAQYDVPGDATSAKADALTRQFTSELARRNRREQIAQQHTLQTKHVKQTAAVPPVLLTLSGSPSGLAAARERLPFLLAQAGGSMKPLPTGSETDRTAPSVPIGETAPLPAPSDAPQTGQTLVLRVPAAQLPHLLKALGALGTLRRADSGPKPGLSAPRRLAPGTAPHEAIPDRPLALKLSPDRKGFVTLRVQFLPAEPTR